MRCNMVVELQGVLSRPLYTIFTKLVKACNGRIRAFNQETNEFVVILDHDFKRNVCSQVGDIASLCNYCIGYVRLHVILEGGSDKDKVLKLIRGKGELIKAYNGYRFLVRRSEGSIIGLYNVRKNVISFYIVDKPIEKFKLAIMSASEIHDYIITNCNFNIFEKHYSVLRNLCGELLIGSP